MPVEPRRAASRLAPSPTGPLHVGNACTFLVNWALARNLGWHLHLRLEDLDAARVRAAPGDVLADLAWLGIDHDGALIRQSDRMALYEEAMHRLAAAGLVYRCTRSRSQVRRAAAPSRAAISGHVDPEAADTADATDPLHAPHAPPPLAFPAALRPEPGEAWGFTAREVNHRLRVEDEPVEIHDELQGTHLMHPARSDGDFIVWTKAGYPAYQLAVVVDDLAQGVTDVVRGADLLPSAALQELIYRALGGTPPRWWHLPLVLDAQGKRMAKRHDSASLAALRGAGADPARVVGLTAWWIGAQADLQPMEPLAFREALTPSMLRAWCARAATHPPTLTAALLNWLAA